MVHVTSNTSLSIDSPQGRKLFVFDRVFGPDVMQDGIWEYLTDSINAFTQGYNVSLLAYGQSGAGKSYTMGTASATENPDDMGMVLLFACLLTAADPMRKLHCARHLAWLIHCALI